LLFDFFLGLGEFGSQLVDVFSCVLVALQVVGAFNLEFMESFEATCIEFIGVSERLLT
jgi:hypothetical protein